MARHTRRRTRVSRPLIAALGLTMAIGGSIYIRNVHKSQAAASRRAAEATVANASAPLPPQSPIAGAPLPSGSVTLQNVPLQLAAIDTTPLPPIRPAALVTQTPVGTAGNGGRPASAAFPASPATQPTGEPKPVSATVASSARLQPTSTGAAAPPAYAAQASVRLAGAAPASSSGIVADASAKLASGDLLGARTTLNDALLAGRLNGPDAASARKSLSEISQTVIFSKKRFKDDPFQTLYQVQNGDRLARIADRHNVTWELLCRINGLADPRKVRAGQWIKIPNGPFHCVISKAVYRMDLYLGSPGEAGSLFVGTFPVGLGKDNSTPTGQWVIQQGGKAHPATYYSPRGEGVIAADDPKNPLGGYWMGLTGVSGAALEKSSYGIHGTIEPDSIGKQASMGCIRLAHEDIALLYDLLIDGKSKVVVKE